MTSYKRAIQQILTPLCLPLAIVSASEIERIEKEHNIPDFSYAGYARGELPIPEVEGPVFDVTDFGAIPDDEKSDRSAIQKAINAAQDKGGGVVFFPPGIFYLNAKSDAATITIASSNIVLRGSGKDAETGTTLFMSHEMAPPPPMKLYGSPPAIQFASPKKGKKLGRIVKDAQAGNIEITLEDTSKLRAGQWIAVTLLDNSPELIKREMAGFQKIDPRWTALTTSGVHVNSFHQIKNIDGNTVQLRTPLIKSIDAQYNWRIESFHPIENVGVERIRFLGNWHGRFVHHRSWQDDGAYTMLDMIRVSDSWIRDCEFKDFNRVASIKGSAHVTVMDCDITGTPGHNSVSVPGSTYCLLARVIDTASHWHGPGVAKPSIGNVLYKCYWNSDTSFESHSSQPRFSLFDSCTGGFLKGRAGGASKNLPTHAEGLILWNFMKTNPELEDFQFEPLDELFWRFLQPLIVGMHGTPISFREGQCTTISHGTPHAEGSLYEFQVKRRLGSMPEYLAD